ncbi:hypothetical protein EZV73_27500 [Acidaminobacter sp. JC074]|uniref:hypothetical protein n=1 Tax=Acidaminobacter sp. JC074 TaxID=2530199 RepID=UPI001F0D1BD4|nr:hypothetical protein [Acidaminobacter sp. JC074]MCH4891347.1 hypothetical protein [Acidaminobacter sp. JC074]
MVRELYADLNLLYLKLFQYEKYMGSSMIEPVFDRVNADIETLQNQFNRRYSLSDMQLFELLQLSDLKPFSNSNKVSLKDLLEEDCQHIEKLKQRIYIV